MLQLKTRVRYSSLGVAAARLFSSGPAENPVVFLDIEADSEPLGRIIVEVVGQLSNVSLSPKTLVSLQHVSVRCAQRQRMALRNHSSVNLDVIFSCS